MIRRYLLLAPMALLLSSCAEPVKKAEQKKEPPKPAEPLGGQSAFHQMYMSARAWAPDAQGLQMTSIQLDDLKAEPGKAGGWQATFVSVSKAQQKTFTWYAMDIQPSIRKGVFSAREEGYRPGRIAPFLTAGLKKDSVEAYKKALEKAMVQHSKRIEGQPVNFILSNDEKRGTLAWRVYWGNTLGTSRLSMIIDATTGEWVETRF